MDHDAHHRMTEGERPRSSATPQAAREGAASPTRNPETRVEKSAAPDEWEPPIIKTIAARNEGLGELAGAVARHRTWLESTGKKQERERTRAATQFVSLLRDRLLKRALERLERDKGNLASVAERIASLELDPYALADELAGDRP